MKLSAYHIFLMIKSPKIHTDLLWDLTVLFLGLAALYFVSIFFFRNRASRLFRRRGTKRTELAPIISNFLFHSSEDPKEAQKEYVELKIGIREYLADNYFRKILADILFDLQRDVAGGTRQRLFRLFVELGLHHDSYKKLKSWRWNIVAQGILELAQMEVSHAFQSVAKFINDKRGIVRKQAELAIVHLKVDGINYLLDNTKYGISEWQQLKLIEALESITDYNPPRFKTWLISENKDVVLFSLRLIKHYNQNDAADSIIALVKHKDNDIKIAAIHCIRDFHFTKAMDALKLVFAQCSPIVKASLLDTMGEIGSEADLEFLKHVARTEPNFSIANRANRAINTIQPDAILPTKDILEDADFVMETITESPAIPSDGEGLPVENVEVPETGEVIPAVAEKVETIEIEEIQIYDLVEVHTQPKEPEEEEELSPVSEEKSHQLEILELEADLERSLNFSLGLVPVDAAEIDETPENTDYAEMSQESREQLLDEMTENGGASETPLLEFMMEHEEDPELRFKAFNRLRNTAPKSQGPEIAEVEAVEEVAEIALDTDDIGTLSPEHSVFYSLFEHASDLDSKKILIKETIAIGDEKEIAFLNHLAQNEGDSIKDEALKALKAIKERRTNDKNVPSTITSEELLEDVDSIVDEILEGSGPDRLDNHKRDADDGTDPTDDRIPLELCFIYDELGILYNGQREKEDLGLNFELSQEYMYNLKEQG